MGKTILMIHGVEGGDWHWDNYKSFFESKGYRCITPNLRYHEEGAVQPHPSLGATSIGDYVKDLEEMLNDLPSDTILMGHSMGGLLALILSSRGYGSEAVLITPATPCGIFALSSSVIKDFLSVVKRWGFWRKPFKQTFKEAKDMVLGRLGDVEAKGYYRRFSYESGRALFEIGFWFLDKNRTSCVDKKTLTHPVLVLGATQDRAVPITAIRTMVKRYETAYMEYPEHSHAILGEKGWEKVSKDILAWIESR